MELFKLGMRANGKSQCHLGQFSQSEANGERDDYSPSAALSSKTHHPNHNLTQQEEAIRPIRPVLGH